MEQTLSVPNSEIAAGYTAMQSSRTPKQVLYIFCCHARIIPCRSEPSKILQGGTWRRRQHRIDAEAQKSYKEKGERSKKNPASQSWHVELLTQKIVLNNLRCWLHEHDEASHREPGGNPAPPAR